MLQDVFSQAWHEIAARPSGPMAFRYYLQPAMAAFFAVRDGLRDARAGNPPYFWALFTRRGHRKELLRGGWKSIGRIIILALAMDLVYQITVLHGLRPIEGIFVAFELAVMPYLLLRGTVTRITRRRLGPGSHGADGTPQVSAGQGD